MKVLMINSVSGYGSTGTICEDIAFVLEKEGHECFIAYGQATTNYKKSFKIGTILENHLHNLGSRIFGKQGYFTQSGTKKLLNHIDSINPDIIHLHNLHGNYLNLPLLFEYLIKLEKPIVWTFHDCWAFTGKCAHYTDVACYKWQSHCDHCPQTKKYPPSLFLDKSKLMFFDKKKWFTSIKNLRVVTVSNWLENEVKKSFFKSYPIKTIYNWVDTEIFKSIDSKDVITEYGLNTNAFTVLLVSAHWNENDVKWKDLLALSKLVSNDVQLIVIGHIENKSKSPKNVFHINYINSKIKLAQLYSFSDVYVHLSTEDTFGKVIAEALSCGTPAIVYDSTACPEIIGEGCGYVVEKRNVNQMAGAINTIKKNPKTFYSANCRNYVIENFNIYSNIHATIDIYKSLKNDI